MKSFRIIEIREGEIAISVDGETGIVPVRDVRNVEQSDVIDVYVEAIASWTPLAPDLIRMALKAHVADG